MFSKFTIIGLIIGSIISILGAASMVDSFANPNETQDTNETFGIGDADKIRFNAPENSFQTVTISGEAVDLKIITPDESNNVDQSIKGKATFSWTNPTEGENTIQIQNTGNSEFIVSGTFELKRDPLFFTYSILVIVAGIVIIGFSAGFSVRKPKGF
ncbi:MAG: hypothetical protein QF559_02580 [Candidatus Nitrosopelagicus sp.]|nr:hypothetical protein [Candidatus Nitrosopelagicus sp.]